MKAKGEFWRDGGLIYFVANGNVYAAKPTDVADSRSGYLQGRWESSVEQWNRYADALGRPKVSLSSLRDRIALAAVKRELSIKVGDKVNTRNGVGVVKVIDSSSYSITMLDVLLTEGKDKGERIYIPESGAEKV